MCIYRILFIHHLLIYWEWNTTDPSHLLNLGKLGTQVGQGCEPPPLFCKTPHMFFRLVSTLFILSHSLYRIVNTKPATWTYSIPRINMHFINCNISSSHYHHGNRKYHPNWQRFLWTRALWRCTLHGAKEKCYFRILLPALKKRVFSGISTLTCLVMAYAHVCNSMGIHCCLHCNDA